MPGPWEKYQQADSAGPWSKYQQPEPGLDPDRGAGQKAIEFGRGEARGLAQDAATSGRVLSYLPKGALDPIPGVGPAARLIQSLGPAAGRWGDQPVGSDYEKTGRVVGRDVLPMLAPGGVGGRAVGATFEGATRFAPTLLQLYTLLHHPYLALLGKTGLHEMGSKLFDLANAAAPLAGTIGRGIGHAAEKIGAGELGGAIPGASQDDQDQPPAQPSRPGPPRGREPRPDPDTDAPVAERSGRGDRLPLYRPPAN